MFFIWEIHFYFKFSILEINMLFSFNNADFISCIKGVSSQKFIVPIYSTTISSFPPFLTAFLSSFFPYFLSSIISS
jgi:hypothetical protein